MTPIVVKDQVRLSFRRTFALTLTGISYRLFRSLVTMSILALAVAFLAYMLGNSIVLHDAKVRAREELSNSRLLGRWVSRLVRPDSPATIQANLVHDRKPRLREYRQWSASDADMMERMQSIARDLTRMREFLARLPGPSAVVLTGGLDARAAVNTYAKEENFRAFRTNMDDLGIAAPFENLDRLRQLLLHDQRTFHAWVSAVQKGQRRAIADVESAFPEEDPRALFARQPERLAAALQRAGFHVQGPELSELQELARTSLDTLHLTRLLEEPRHRSRLARRLNTTQENVTARRVIEWLTSAERAEWLAGNVIAEEPGVDISAQRLLTIASFARRQKHLERIAGTADGDTARTGLLALPLHVRALIGLSFLVCVVGVTNAMFMSVSERFTEIATMKCLGALDFFLMVVFLFESALLGVIGAVIGIVVGMVVALGRSVLFLGGFAFESLPVGALGISVVICLFSGLVLAVVAAVAPAYMAARLPPMEAMRVE